MRKLITLVAVLAFAVVGCSQSGQQSAQGDQPADYGNNPRLDNLYDSCSGGDAAACEDLYLESPVDSDYEAFAIQQGGADSFRAPETTMQAPEPEQVSLGETFELRGTEWNIGEVSVEDTWTDPETYGGDTYEGAFLFLTGTVTNVSDDYRYADASVNITVYTTQTSYDVASNTSIMASVEENLLIDELAPDASKTGAELIDIDSAEEEVVYIAWEDAETFEPLVEMQIQEG